MLFGSLSTVCHVYLEYIIALSHLYNRFDLKVHVWSVLPLVPHRMSVNYCSHLCYIFAHNRFLNTFCGPVMCQGTTLWIVFSDDDCGSERFSTGFIALFRRHKNLKTLMYIEWHRAVCFQWSLFGMQEIRD